jgi:hypothetical protein
MSPPGKILPMPTRRPRGHGQPQNAEAPPRARRQRRVGWLLAAFALAGTVFYIVGAIHGNTVALRRLPPSERSMLYRHAVEELETTCLEPAAAGGRLRDHCTQQANFILGFPDCDQRCRRAATIVLPHARR